MFELALLHVNHADREREVAADLRRRQILKAAASSVAPVERYPVTTPSLRRVGAPVRAAER